MTPAPSPLSHTVVVPSDSSLLTAPSIPRIVTSPPTPVPPRVMASDAPPTVPSLSQVSVESTTDLDRPPLKSLHLGKSTPTTIDQELTSFQPVPSAVSKGPYQSISVTPQIDSLLGMCYSQFMDILF